jgi:predicted RNA-binding Zn-ribbon protein involved in translation (DUF1610 family)
MEKQGSGKGQQGIAMAAERKERKESKTIMVCQLCKREVEPIKTPFKCPHCGGSMFSVKLGHVSRDQHPWKQGGVYEAERAQKKPAIVQHEPIGSFADTLKRRVDETLGQWLRRNMRWFWAVVKRAAARLGVRR